MMNRHFLVLMLAIFLPITLSAQKTEQKIASDTLSGIWNRYMVIKQNADNLERMDTLSKLYEKQFAVLKYLNASTTPERYIATNPHYYRLFVPLTYYYEPMNSLSVLRWQSALDEQQASSGHSVRLYDAESFTALQRTNAQVNRILLDTYVDA
ncbi:MAG: hypothetical protein IJ494_03870, partial [Bacteroides sp.]|nr:hypothetical protein [Bacteroides sp.]